MRQNAYFTMEKQSSSPQAQGESDFESEIQFKSTNYGFPNYVQICKKCKSLRTVLTINQASIPEEYTKRLSMLNRSHFTIKLKQIKKQQDLQEANKNISKLLLYYEAVPFSMEYAKEGPLNIYYSPARLEKYLNQIIADLLEVNIYNEFTIANCGFTETGDFRVYIPPNFVFHQKKLNYSDKQAMVSSAQLIVKYWQADLPKTIAAVLPKQESRSIRLNSPQVKRDVQNQEQRPHKKSQEEAIDIKKTIKLSKNYVKQIYDKIQEEKYKKSGKVHELKKAKSMETLINGQENKSRKCSHFLNKINQLNKKLVTIRENFVKKKSSGDDLVKVQLKNTAQQEMQIQQFQNHNLANAEHCNQQIIFDKYEQIIPEKSSKIRQIATYPCTTHDDDGYSVDTYMQELRGDDGIIGIRPYCQMRKTALPSHLLNQNNNQENKNSNWHHESAGNMMFKRFIQKNKERYPELFEQKDTTSLSKISAVNGSERKKLLSESPKKQQGSRLKKMLSMQTFENQLETNSIHLSQYSNELSNVKRKKEKQVRNKQIKAKVQEILMKSKKAIELLKSPSKTPAAI